MGLDAELKAEVAGIFRSRWAEREGRVVPESDDLGLGNDCIKLDAVVLYADLADSTSLVDTRAPRFAAGIYKTFLHCTAKIIRSEGGEITAYDGDRVMAVYLGDSKNTRAARTALKINYARLKIIQPALEAQYPNEDLTMKHKVGIDSGELHVARTGIRGANDLVWVGRAANHAAKLCALSADFPSRVSEDVFQMMHASAKVTDGRSMWERATWTGMGRDIYRSTWWWPIS